MKKLLVIIGCLLGIQHTQAQLVLTVAGVLEQEGATDGLAFDATFSNPHGIAVGPDGTVYISDRFGHRIRKLSPDGIVTTIAGNGTTGSTDGVGEAASFNEPWGLCIGNDGNIYVADTRNNLIRMITPDGTVSTIAGSGNYGTSDGFSTSATFGNPTGIEMDDNGNIYVADHLTHIIRRIDPNGFVSTIAGLPYTPGALDGIGNNAMFYRPYGLTIDNQGNILVADEWNHLIRRVTPEGEVTTIAGTGVIGHENGPGQTATFNYPWDLTVDSLGVIFVGDGYNQVIRRIVPSASAPTTYVVSTFAGTVGISGGQDGFGTSASFNGATGIAYNELDGDFYVADAYNNLVRRLINLQTQEVGVVITSEGGSQFCLGEILEAQAVPDNFTQYTFYLNGETVQTSDDAYFSTLGLPAGTHELQVLASDITGSYFSNVINIEVESGPDPEITPVGPTTFFEGDSVILIASNGTEFLWSNGETSQTITVFESGMYTVEVVDVNGCTGISEPVEVVVQIFSEAPQITFLEGGSMLCYEEVAVLQSSYPNNNQWYFDGWPITDATGQTLEVSVAGEYQVQVTDTLGFNIFSEVVTIEILPLFLDDFTADRLNISEEDPTVSFSAQTENTIARYDWDFGDIGSGVNNNSNLPNPMHTYSGPGIYTVQLTVEDSFGCLDSLIKTNYITYREPTAEPIPGNPADSVIYIPNAFTPNGDDFNDIFRVRGETITGLDLQVFNQWGELIFVSTDPQAGWDGTHRNEPAAMGTYTYTAKVELASGLSELRSGHVSLLR